MNTKPNELQDLASDYYMRDLTTKELAELQQGLKRDPELRNVFMRAASDEWLLNHMHHTHCEPMAKSQRPRLSRRRILSMAAGIAVLLSLGALFMSQKNRLTSPKTAMATVTDCFVLPSDAITVVNEGKTRTIKETSTLRRGDRVILPPGGRLTFQYLQEATTVNMGSGALFTLSERDGAKQIHLTMGRMSADVAKQAPGKPMRIFTDDAEAVVLGTSFELFAADITRLTVNSGCVRFNSPDAHQSLEVPSGYLAESKEHQEWKRLPFSGETLTPCEDSTIGNPNERDASFISVDWKRKYFGYLKFDMGNRNTPLLEAKLRLRVMHKGSDTGGSGTVRLYSLSGDSVTGSRKQISQYIGKVGAGMDLEFEIHPAALTEGINTLLIEQDEGGNDFWFSSSKGDVAPQLLLKMETDSTVSFNDFDPVRRTP